MTTQRAEVICDSYGEHSPRLTTFKLRYHKFIHGELMTHRMLSRNASSSRAVPVAKLLEEAQRDDLRATPVWWGAEQKGMQSGAELTGDALEEAQSLWAEAVNNASYYAGQMVRRGVHKSIANRLIEPGTHINVVATGVEDAWLNFFGLRLDKAAQPEMRALAEIMWAAWNESIPRKLQVIDGTFEWHLPFVDEREIDRSLTDSEIYFSSKSLCGPDIEDGWMRAIRVSVARCARVSYLSFDTGKRSTFEEDLALYDRLVGAQPLHASPAEHQAHPDTWMWSHDRRKYIWMLEELGFAGNLIGWCQYRKWLEGERIAPLPQGYEYKWRKP